jgi:hypothetical protein
MQEKIESQEASPITTWRVTNFPSRSITLIDRLVSADADAVSDNTAPTPATPQRLRTSHPGH